ncbi:MAG: epoxyqueuosine reductase [Candidatus Hodarchaeota archaeon]
MITMQEEIKDMAKDFIEEYKKINKIKTKWKETIVAFANAKDPIFLQLKQAVNEDHKLPHELLKNANSIITFFVSFNKEVVLSNSNGINASKEWAIAYIETNKLVSDLSRFLANSLNEKNYDCFEVPPILDFDKKKLMCYWSHKHVAYIAGLGKFGLHKLLITEKGCCGRLGSLITSAKIEATKRSEENYCLYFQNGSCTHCIDKCIFGVFNNDFFDRHKCYEICLKNGKFYSKLGPSDMCGKCACGVPCSLTNPCK